MPGPKPSPDATARLPKFIEEVYNAKRMHSALGYQSPNEFVTDHQQRIVHCAGLQIAQQLPRARGIFLRSWREPEQNLLPAIGDATGRQPPRAADPEAAARQCRR